MSLHPEGWVQTTLGEIVRLRGEKAIPAVVPHLPFLGLEDVEAHKSRIIKYTKASDVKSAGARFSAGEILYSRLRPYLNKVVIAEGEGLASAEFLVLQPEVGIQGEFIRHRVMTEDFLAFVALLDRGDRPRVNFEQIAKFTILLPPAPEQSRIVAKLEALLAGVARAHSELDSIPILIANRRQALLDQEFLALPEERRPLEELVDATRGIPYGIIQTGSEHLGGVPTVRAGDIKDFRIHLNELKRVDPKIEQTYLRTRLRGGEVLISIRGTVGNVAVAGPELAKCNISREVALIPPCEHCLPKFLAYFLSTSPVQSFLRRHTKGVAQTGINLGDLRQLPTPIPPLAVQREISERLTAAFGAIDRLVLERERATLLAKKLDQAILAKAFRGELLPQDPSDEPASVLLERIRAERAAANASSRVHKRRDPKLPRAPQEKAAMTKSRFDSDVKDQPYLAGLIKTNGGKADVDVLFSRADLPVADFYKQLAWEVAAGHIRDAGAILEAA